MYTDFIKLIYIISNHGKYIHIIKYSLKKVSQDCLEHVIDKSLLRKRFIDFLFQMSKIENSSLSGQQ